MNEDFDSIREYLKKNLKIEVESGDFTDPNNRIVVLKLEGKEISSSKFSVRERDEYEG